MSVTQADSPTPDSAVRSSASLTPIFNPVYPLAHCQIARCLDLRLETPSLIFFTLFDSLLSNWDWMNSQTIEQYPSLETFYPFLPNTV